MAKAGLNMSRYLHVRVTPDEDRLAKLNADLLGTTVSEYIRSLLAIPIVTSEDEPPRIREGCSRFIVYNQTTYEALRRQIRAYGYHYNQAIYALNIIKSKRFLGEEEARELFDRAVKYLEDIDDVKDDMLNAIEFLFDCEHVSFRPKASKYADDEEADLE